MLFRDFISRRYPKTARAGSLNVHLRPLEPADQPRLLGFVRIAHLPEHVLDRRGGLHDLILMSYDLQGEETSPVD